MIEEIFGFFIFRFIFNPIGAKIRWVYGLIWRTIFNKPKFTFKEYLNGPKKKSDFYDDFTHGANNSIIGLIFFFIITYFIVKWNI